MTRPGTYTHLALWCIVTGRQLARSICGLEGIRLKLVNDECLVDCPKCWEIMKEN